MLVDVNLDPDPMAVLIREVIEDGRDIKRLKRGIYLGGLNFHSETSDIPNDLDSQYPEFSFMNCYGVVDSIEQFERLFSQRLEKLPEKYVVSLCRIAKENQPERGGWRWHKWGPYYGSKNSKCEYLYDEPEIDEVYVFHVYRVIDNK